MDSTTAPTPGRGRFRTPEKPTAAEKQQAREVSLRRIARLFAPYRGSVLVVVAIIVAVVDRRPGLAVPAARGHRRRTPPARTCSLLVLLTAGMVAVAAVTSVLGVVQTWISTQIGQRVMHGLRTDVFAHLQRQSIAFFTRTRTGEVQSRITNDIGGMQSVVTSTATSIASNLTTTVATAVAMAALSWRLSLVSLVVLPPAVWLTRRVARMRRDITAAQQRELADLNVTVEEGLSINGVQLAKSLGTGPALVRRFTESSARLIDLELRSQLAGRWRMASMSVLFAAIPAVIYLSAGLPMTAGTMTIGTLIAFTALQGQLFRPLMGLLNTGVQVVSSLALFQRVFEYLDLPVDIDEPTDPVDLDPAAGERATSASSTSASRYAGGRGPGAGGRRPRRARPAAPWPSSARPARARPRSARWSPGSTTRRRVAVTDRRRRRTPDPAGRPRRRSSASSARRPTCCTPRCARTCATPGPDATDAEIEARRPRRPDPRPDRLAARRLRHRGRLARPPVLRWREAAHRDRAHAAAQPADPGPRRGHQRAGHRDRAGRAGGVRHPGRGPHHDHHRAPALDGPRRRPDRRARPRPGRRARHPRGAARGGGAVRRPGAPDRPRARRAWARPARTPSWSTRPGRRRPASS